MTDGTGKGLASAARLSPLSSALSMVETSPQLQSKRVLAIQTERRALKPDGAGRQSPDRPASPDSPKVPAPPASIEPTGRKPRVLVVDDSALNRKLVRLPCLGLIVHCRSACVS